MTFRHRHSRLSRLIEIAEIEEGKVEVGERQKKRMRTMDRQSGAKGEHSAAFCWLLCFVLQHGAHVFPALASIGGKRLRKSTSAESNQAPSPQRESCRTFLDPRTE